MLEVRKQGSSLDAILWSFVGGSPVMCDWPTDDPLPASTTAAAAMSKELKQRGFRFVGPTTCYALIQAAGLVNDNHPTCFRRDELS